MDGRGGGGTLVHCLRPSVEGIDWRGKFALLKYPYTDKTVGLSNLR